MGLNHEKNIKRREVDILKKSGNRDYLKYISLGSEIAVGLCLPILGGYWLDSSFQTLPLFTLLGVMIGIMIMIAIVIRLYKELNRGDE